LERNDTLGSRWGIPTRLANSGELQAVAGRGGRIQAHYPGSNADLETLWQNPANFSNSSGTDVSQTFTPPAGATEMQFSYQLKMDSGWLAFSDPALNRLRSK
jgi:hypothetical protein